MADDMMLSVLDVAQKLIGPIDPVGESRTDEKRFQNLKQHCELIELLVQEVEVVAMNQTRVEHSMRKAGEFAAHYLRDLGNFG